MKNVQTRGKRASKGLGKSNQKASVVGSGAIDRFAAAAAVDAFLRAIGRDPAMDPELVGTGKRVADAYLDELCAGYALSPEKLLRENLIHLPHASARSKRASATTTVVLRNAAISTMCPHHLLPSTGTVSIAYAPRGSLVGVGALFAVAEALAKRLSLQEALTEGVVSAIESVLDPRWVACSTRLSHGCMTLRGERAHGAQVEVLVVRGIAELEAAKLFAGS